MLVTSLSLWPKSADEMREALHVSGNCPLQCQAQTLKKKCCTKSISEVNRKCIQQLLSDAVLAGSWNAARTLFERLSKLIFCNCHGHQDQGGKRLLSWQSELADAEKQLARSRPVTITKSTWTVTINATIKFESKDIHTHTEPAVDSKVTPKSEPEDDIDSSPLLKIPHVQEDTKPTHVFVPYGNPRTQLQINTEIKKHLEKPLSKKEQELRATPGVVYIYKHTGAASGDEKPHLKIGYSANLDARMKQWQRLCGYDAKQMSHTGASLYMRVERLVHAQLWASRKREVRCPGCEGGHKEFFDVRLHEANKVIGLWAEWTEHVPYAADGTLKEAWREKLGKVDLNNPDCWEGFTAKD